MHQRPRVEALRGEQRGHAFVGVAVGRINLQHAAPGPERLVAAAQGFEGAGVALPDLDPRRIGLGRSLQMPHRLRQPAFGLQEGAQSVMGHKVARREFQHPPPGLGLGRAIPQIPQRLGQPPPWPIACRGGFGHDPERPDRFPGPLGQQLGESLGGLQVWLNALLDPPPGLDPGIGLAGLDQGPGQPPPALDVGLVELDQGLQARNGVGRTRRFDQQVGRGVKGFVAEGRIQHGGAVERGHRGVDFTRRSSALGFAKGLPGPATRIPLSWRHQRCSRRVPRTPAPAASGWARTMMPTILIRLG